MNLALGWFLTFGGFVFGVATTSVIAHLPRYDQPSNKDLSRQLEKIMTTIENVNTALDSLGTSLGNQLTAIQTEIQQLAAGGGATPDQLQAVAERIGQFKAGVDQTIADLNADDPAPSP